MGLAKDEIEWSPLVGGGTNFKTLEMTTIAGKVLVKRSHTTLGLILFFSVIGIPLLLFGLYSLFQNGPQLGVGFIFFFAAGFCFPAYLILVHTKECTFDRSTGFYHRGKEYDRNQSLGRTRQGQLSEIFAIQLIEEGIRMRDSNRPFVSCEVNLVFKDGFRLNVMDHGNQKEIDDSVKQLAEFLNVPIWTEDQANR